MANLFYSATGAPVAQARGASSSIRAEFTSLQAGFDKIPMPATLVSNNATLGIDSGAASAYVVAASSLITALTDGMEVVFKAVNSATGASTVNVNALGVKSVTRPDGSALGALDIVAGQYISMRYSLSAGAFQVTSGISAPNTAAAINTAIALNPSGFITSLGNAATATSASQLGTISYLKTLQKRRTRINTIDSTSLNTSITAPEMGFSYGGSGEVIGPFITFGGLVSNIDYSCQISANYTDGSVMQFRTRNDDVNTISWNPWRVLYHNGNLTNVSQLTNDSAYVAGTAFAISKSANGYQKLPSGLIIQWGVIPSMANIGANLDSSTGITFPIAFTTSIYSALVTTDSRYAPGAAISLTLSSFGVSVHNYYTAALTVSGTWIAIGF